MADLQKQIDDLREQISELREEIKGLKGKFLKQILN